MKREAESTQAKARKYLPPKDKFWDRFPYLAQVLSDQFWDDGAPRDCPQLGITVYPDRVRVSIVDLASRRSTETTADSVQGALELVEALCSGPCLPWRLWDRPGKPRK